MHYNMTTMGCCFSSWYSNCNYIRERVVCHTRRVKKGRWFYIVELDLDEQTISGICEDEHFQPFPFSSSLPG